MCSSLWTQNRISQVKRNSDQKILPLGCNFKIFRMALTDTMTLLILVNFLTQFKLLIQQIFGATSDHRGNQHMRSGAKQFPTFNRICTRDECMNSHTKQFSFRLYLFFPLPLLSSFLSFYSFFPSSFFLSVFPLRLFQFLPHSCSSASLRHVGFYGPLGWKITDPSKSNDVESEDLFLSPTF